MVPPVKLYDAGVPNEAVLRIVARNSRMPESLRGDIDAECAACRMGARRVEELFERYGRAAVEACFDAIIARTHRDVPARGARARSPTASTRGRTTPSTTASTRRACTRSA